MLPLFGQNPTEFRLIFHSVLFIIITITDYSHGIYFFLQPQYLKRYADAIAGKGAPLYDCFDFVDETVTRICRSVLKERVVYSHRTRVHGAKFQSVVLSNGLIINLKGQWESQRLDCVLCFMSWVY